MITDKQIELLRVAIKKGVVSHCCSAPIYKPTEEWSVCTDCHEYCDEVSEQ